MDPHRRTVLTLGALSAAVLAGCSAPAAPRPGPSGGTPTATAAPPAAGTTSSGAPWGELAGKLKGTLVLPDDKAYASDHKTENPRYDGAKPLAILRAETAEDVAAGLAFARAHGVPLALRAGGHNYAGWSAGGAEDTGVDPSLVIDVRPMKSITVNGERAVVGAGAQLVDVYSALAGRNRAIAGGSCPTVGITGLALGGGVGVLSRKWGLTCDQLEELEIVTADGKIRTVNAENDPDLFWACRGGGGGQFGVVTSLTLATHVAPDITVFFLSFPFSAAADVVTAWQEWAPGADNNLWSTCKLLGGGDHDTPVVRVAGTWAGPSAGLTAPLNEFLRSVGTAPTSKSVRTHGYGDAMLLEAGCQSVGAKACRTDDGGTLTRENLAATSHIANKPLTAAGIADLIARIRKADDVGGLIEAGVSLDALGGAVSERAGDATAFGHRAALYTVQYTATWKSGSGRPYDDYVRANRAEMVPHWGDGAYVNYADASLTNGPESYFGDNLPRLRETKKTYDPDGLFAQPQSV